MFHPESDLARAVQLRYGENPQQQGYFLPLETDDPLALSRFTQLQGIEPSYTNYLDADGAIFTLTQLGGERPACAIVKHATPCGAAVADTIHAAYERAWDGDPLAAFGGVLAVNRPVDRALAREMLRGKVVHVLLAPTITEDAVPVLQRRTNLRVLVNPGLTTAARPYGCEWRTIRGGLLVQTVYDGALDVERLAVVTERQPRAAEWADLQLAWGLVAATRSNAIVLVREGMLVGSGAGQQDRKRACELAVAKAGERTAGAVAASDAFFPFARNDALQDLLDAGVTAIVQPGGAQHDQDAVDLCNERQAAMVFTGGIRAFRH